MSTTTRCSRGISMTMTMTHSEKSHIHRMKAWPYRQECRGHDPTKKNLFRLCSLLIGKVCRYKLLEGQSVSQRYLRWTQCTKNKKIKQVPQAIAVLSSQINSESSDSEQSQRVPPGDQEKRGHQGGGWQNTTIQQSFLLLVPNFVLSYEKYSYSKYFLLVENPSLTS